LHGRILVVEDNAVNQRVAMTMLKQLGCTVDTATNGRQALEALSHTPYDLVFMDCLMPEMDGFAATRAIREREAHSATGESLHQTHPAPLPIIALTANAIEGDRERCLAAGMNDYLSKPFNRGQLQEILTRWLPRFCADRTPSEGASNAPRTAAAAVPEAVSTPSIDYAVWADLRALADETDLYREVLQIYLDDTPPQLVALRAAITDDDAHTIQRLAHSLKSSSTNVGAMLLAELCHELELMGRLSSTVNAAALLRRIEDEYKVVTGVLRTELRHYTGTPSSQHAA